MNHKPQNSKLNSELQNGDEDQDLLLIIQREIGFKKITNQFQDKLGQGGYGTVYKGKLSNEVLVAVKILSNSKGNGEEFINEVRTMGRIHHVNVVCLVGFCADGFSRALIYEFLPNESLEKFIFSTTIKNRSLGWKKLQDIALGIAQRN
ncbi:Rust resistance kinase Lr10 [Vitis vinifera]|uniref:Rust resistance kinase Lr10 n=1 Tax=Vitis vinifera TaxID=29760 RepID=A0A438CHD8_VITVI|nr:Rust resistance kinase Lr10 [Vitis vinifera]